MGDMGDFWNDVKPVMKAESNRKKKRNSDFALNKLKELDVDFDSHNLGIHLVVRGNGHIIDYWPSTGKFINRKNNKSYRGINRLLKMVGKKQ